MGVGVARGPGEGYWSGVPGSIDGMRQYFLDRGFHEGPTLEADEGQILSFEKPLPVGRVHLKIFRGSKYYTIVQHQDVQDPNRNPVGHVQDILFSPDKIHQRVKRTDIQ